uniref:Schwannomin interacting protein 1 C-terminal domain-containing protein n=1 Tax=Scylla olivacea TaxID=85551 RepID=A0A0P4W4B7_SCYOL
MFGKFMASQQQSGSEDQSCSVSSATRLQDGLGLPSVNLSSIKEQTAKVSSQVLSSLKAQSGKVSKLLWNEGSNAKTDNETRAPRPTLLEQLKWPVLIDNKRQWLHYVSGKSDEEEDIVDKFIRVITIEDADEHPEDTFYNHPARRRNDREEIRRKLAMGLDEDQTTDRPHRKPSLHSRLQSGMNLQICFMNETASDCESQCSDTESTQDREVDSEQVSTTSANSKAQLQQEARLALAQAKEMARMQMEIEKQSRKKSPIAEVVRASFNKIGVPFPDSKRRISRQILTDMNVAQLQVIVNDLHTQIESLNEDLVTFLMERDDLHMEQDSMLVDIEDLTKHIGAKELSLRGDSKDGSIKSLSVLTPPTKTKTNSMRLKGSSKK